jgi:hypothetical protein
MYVNANKIMTNNLYSINCAVLFAQSFNERIKIIKSVIYILINKIQLNNKN